MTDRFDKPRRAQTQTERTDAAVLAERVGDLELAIVDIRGEAGTNGKIGALKERFDKAEARKWWLVTFVATTIVTVLGAAIVFGRWMGSIESDVKALKEREYRTYLHQPPADAPASRDP